MNAFLWSQQQVVPWKALVSVYRCVDKLVNVVCCTGQIVLEWQTEYSSRRQLLRYTPRLWNTKIQPESVFLLPIIFVSRLTIFTSRYGGYIALVAPDENNSLTRSFLLARYSSYLYVGLRSTCDNKLLNLMM